MAPIITEFHQAKIDEAKKILEASVDGYLLVVLVSSNDQQHEATRMYYHGGKIQALGLAHLALQQHLVEDVQAVVREKVRADRE